MHRLFAAILLAWMPLAAHAAFPERNDRAVVDAANVIPDAQEAALNREVATWAHKTGHQLVVVTIPSLDGDDIADYGYKLGRYWRLGQTGVDDGALLILAPNERKVRIEVGKGLESVIPDADAIGIISGSITPKLKAGEIGGALTDGAEAIMTRIDANQGAMLVHSQPKPQAPVWPWVVGVLAALAAIGTVVWAVIRRKRSKTSDHSGDVSDRTIPTPHPGSFHPNASTHYDTTYVEPTYVVPVASTVDTYSPAPGYDSSPSYSDPSPSYDSSPSYDNFSSGNTDSNSFSGGGADSSY